MKIRKAVIPAAGLGTRFLPATKVLPKELIPVVDRPGIQWAVEEAVRAGIEDVLIVTSRGKSLLEDHFDRAPELESKLEGKGKDAELRDVIAISEMARVHSVRQMEPLGFGHAVLQARDHIGDEPFVVMVPDEVVPEPQGDEQPLLSRMVGAYETYAQSVIAVKEVPREDVSSYGIVDAESIGDDLARINRFVEKPSVEEAPSNLASVGRYILSPAIFDELSRTKPGVGNEIQLTDGIQAVIEKEGGLAYIHSGPIFDVGRKYDFIKATIELALRRPDLAPRLQELIQEIAARES
jgi:UTP--glucose-1-phosphate uridylyltransferase